MTGRLPTCGRVELAELVEAMEDAVVFDRIG